MTEKHNKNANERMAKSNLSKHNQSRRTGERFFKIATIEPGRWTRQKQRKKDQSARNNHTYFYDAGTAGNPGHSSKPSDGCR